VAGKPASKGGSLKPAKAPVAKAAAARKPAMKAAVAAKAKPAPAKQGKPKAPAKPVKKPVAAKAQPAKAAAVKSAPVSKALAVAPVKTKPVVAPAPVAGPVKAKDVKETKEIMAKAAPAKPAAAAPAAPAVKAVPAAKPAPAAVAIAAPPKAVPPAPAPAPTAKPVAYAAPAGVRPPGAPFAAKPPPPPAGPPRPKVTFAVGDPVVYPTHGVGRIIRIDRQEIAGFQLELLVVEFEKDKLIVSVPVAKAASVGMRRLSSPQQMKTALETLKGRARIKRAMWSRRAQEYQAKINSGDPISIAEVVRDLHRNADQPDQSYSERQIYEKALDRLAHELAAVEKIDDDTAAKRLEKMLKAA
jgi:CarD family transcriptional regulator